MQLRLVPASSDNLKVSIMKPVSTELLGRHLSGPDLARLRALPQKEFFCWAVTKGKKRFWDSIQPGDVVLFSEKGSERFTYKGTTTFKVQCRSLGEALWPFIPGSPWEYIYFLTDVSPIKLPKRSLLNGLGYAHNFALQGSTRVTKERLEKILDQFGDIPKWLDYLQGFAPLSPAVVREPTETYPVERPLVPANLSELIGRVRVLQRDPRHLERDHESLVEEFYTLMGFAKSKEIQFRRGRVDILINLAHKPVLLNEVKRDWSLSKADNKVVQQAFNYAHELGVRHVVITNGDYYAWYDRAEGYSYNDCFRFEFRLTNLSNSDFNHLDTFKRENFTD